MMMVKRNRVDLNKDLRDFVAQGSKLSFLHVFWTLPCVPEQSTSLCFAIYCSMVHLFAHTSFFSQGCADVLSYYGK